MHTVTLIIMNTTDLINKIIQHFRTFYEIIGSCSYGTCKDTQKFFDLWKKRFK